MVPRRWLGSLPLTLEFFTMLVVDGPIYDRLFRSALEQNEESDIVAAGRSKRGLTGFQSIQHRLRPSRNKASPPSRTHASISRCATATSW